MNSTHNSRPVARHSTIICLTIFMLLTMFSPSMFAQSLNTVSILQSAQQKAAKRKTSASLTSTGLHKSAPAHGETMDDVRKKEIKNWEEAAKFVKDHSEDFMELLDFYSKHMKKDALANYSNADDTKMIYYASLALQKQSILERYFSDHQFDPEGDQRKKVEEQIKTIEELVKMSAQPTVSVFATGNIRSVATSKSNEPLAGGTGTIGVTYSSDRHIFSAQVAVASTQDTTRSGFGANVLSPVNGKALKSGLLEWYPQITKDPKNWLHFYGSFASSVWDMDTTEGLSLAKSATVIGVGALFHRKLFGGQLAETEVGLDAEIGLSGRFLGGDVRNLINTEVGKTKYLEAFPSTRSSFIGLEGGFALNFGQLVGAVQAYYLLNKKNEPIDGLSKLQISVGISVRGDIIKGMLK